MRPKKGAASVRGGPGVDPARLRRALLALDVRRAGDDCWRVSGGERVHHVRGGRCDCADTQYRPGVFCAHRLACILDRLPGFVLDGLRDLLEDEE